MSQESQFQFFWQSHLIKNKSRTWLDYPIELHGKCILLLTETEIRRSEIIRKLREIKGVNGAHSELFVVTSPVVERGQGEVIKNQIAIKRVSIEPELVSEANSGHVRAWRLRRCRRRSPLKIRDPRRGRRWRWSCHKVKFSLLRPESVGLTHQEAPIPSALSEERFALFLGFPTSRRQMRESEEAKHYIQYDMSVERTNYPLHPIIIILILIN